MWDHTDIVMGTWRTGTQTAMRITRNSQNYKWYSRISGVTPLLGGWQYDSSPHLLPVSQNLKVWDKGSKQEAKTTSLSCCTLSSDLNWQWNGGVSKKPHHLLPLYDSVTPLKNMMCSLAVSQGKIFWKHPVGLAWLILKQQMSSPLLSPAKTETLCLGPYTI